MVNNRFLFVISGFISVGLFSLFLALFLYMFLSSTKLHVYAMKKDNYISVSIVMPETNKQNSHKSSSAVVNTASSFSEPKNVDINDLFDNVWTRKIDKKRVKKTVDERKLNDLQKKIKIQKKAPASSVDSKAIDTNAHEQNDEKALASKSMYVNEYLAKIQSIVYKHFYPPQNSQGNSVKALISLSPIGKVEDFRILEYSANVALNKECDKIKERLMTVLFPLNPENKSGNYVVILTAKD